jgi:hypothetical protein
LGNPANLMHTAGQRSMILAYAPDLIENAYAEALIAGKAYVAGNCPVTCQKPTARL